MDSKTGWRVPSWRAFVWAGVVGSVLAWTWAWLVGHGPQWVMLVVAISAVLFAYRAMAGMRVAFVGLMVAGFAMFMASVYWFLAIVVRVATNPSPIDWITSWVFPMVTAIVLLMGAVSGYRHSKRADTPVMTPASES